MTNNVGSTDRALRILIGIALLSVAALSESELRWWGLIGLIPLLTGLVSNCPMYTLFGIDTCRTPKPKT